MSKFVLGRRSIERLSGVHPALVAVVWIAIQNDELDFTVLEGRRTVEKQRKMVANGASQTMNSRHLTGHAVDLAPWVNGKISWDWPLYNLLAAIMDCAAERAIVDGLEWGGNWKSFKDGPHFQLNREIHQS